MCKLEVNGTHSISFKMNIGSKVAILKGKDTSNIVGKRRNLGIQFLPFIGENQEERQKSERFVGKKAQSWKVSSKLPSSGEHDITFVDHNAHVMLTCDWYDD